MVRSPSRRRNTLIRAAGLLTVVAVLGVPGPAGAASGPADPTLDPSFTQSIRRLTPGERQAMTPEVWRRGCPVPLRDLRLLRVSHWTFDGQVADGRLVVHRDSTQDVAMMMAGFFSVGFPIRKMIPIQRYGGSDFRSIEADNTSAFNCRSVAGGHKWSQHAYGRAIDINPLENPYVSRGRTSHRASRKFLDRSVDRPGMLVAGSAAVSVVDESGWEWGGRWRHPRPKDYQHVSATGD